MFVHNLKIGKEYNSNQKIINALQNIMFSSLWGSKSFVSLQSNISVGIMNRKLKAKNEVLEIHRGIEQ